MFKYKDFHVWSELYNKKYINKKIIITLFGLEYLFRFLVYLILSIFYLEKEKVKVKDKIYPF